MHRPKDENREPNDGLSRDGFFQPTKGEPRDECPNCRIWRRHAGNPAACGSGWRTPGCFDPASEEDTDA